MTAPRGEFQERWAYNTLQFRWRFGAAGTTPYLTFGLGDYMHGQPYSETHTDSLGRVTRLHGREVSSHMGANLGAGVTFGRGTRQPDVELRFHWARDQDAGVGVSWATLLLGVVYE